jgi:hypothetical protein
MPDMSKIYAKAFDAKRKIFLGSNAKMLLLDEVGTDRPFDVIETVIAGWGVDFSDYFRDSTFKVADVTSAFAAKVRKSTHLMIVDSTNSGLNNVLFELQGETVPPLGGDAYWRIRATSLRRTYIAPEEV